MGSSASVPAGDDDQAYASAEVDINLLQQELKEMFSFKILCLGAGESGKSTVVKQLKLIHHTKMDEEELNLTRSALHQNVVDSIKAVVAAAQSFGYTDFAPEHLSTIDMLNEHEESTRLTLNEGAAILELFNSPPIQRAYDRRSEFWLLDSFPYYMKHVERFCDPDFEPTEEDSVMARIRTTGIVTSELEHRITKQDEDDPEHIYFEVVDVGGQRNERKKWIHCFSNVRAILFIVNLAGYHQVLFEDSTKNRMVEEMELFEQITHKDVFKDTPIFLFFNKKDLFETTVPHHPLSETFPEYTGPNEMAPCLQYFEESFKRLLPEDKTVHIMSISARWKRDVKNAFEDVKKQLYDSNRPTLLARSKEIKTNIKKLQSKAGIKSSAAGGENSSGSSTTPLIGDRVGCGISWFRRTEVSS